MSESTCELFGGVVSEYTAKQAVEDGVLMNNPSRELEECFVITTNLWSYLEKKAAEANLTEPIELLDIIMKKARIIYVKGKFKGDNNRNFFVINGNSQFKPIWFVRNEYNTLTAMLSSDY